MKLYFATAFLLLSLLVNAQNPYSISFQNISGQPINMSEYAGKKILIIVLDASAPDTTQLQMLDSFYVANNPALSIIALPADDFGIPPDDSTLSVYLTNQLGLHYVIAQTGTAEKNSDNQQVLLKWLTHVSDNMHFDNDITEGGQIYLIDERGILYGLLGKRTSPSFLHAALTQTSSN